MELVYGRSECLGEGKNTYCPGCGYGNIMKIVSEVAVELGIADTLVLCDGVGCYNNTPNLIKFPKFGSQHGRLVATATGFKRCQSDTPLLAFQGDGDCAGIGLMESITAANRGENFTVLMMNNTNFGMTGGQMAPTTLVGQKTTTCIDGREPVTQGYPFRMAEVIATLDAPRLVARVSLCDPKHILEFKKLLKKALQYQLEDGGYSFIEVLSPCPTNWHMSPVDACARVRDELPAVFPLGIFKEV